MRCRYDLQPKGFHNLENNLFVGSIPHPVMGTTRDYCRYIKALLIPYSGAITIGGIDLTYLYLSVYWLPSVAGGTMQGDV